MIRTIGTMTRIQWLDFTLSNEKRSTSKFCFDIWTLFLQAIHFLSIFDSINFKMYNKYIIQITTNIIKIFLFKLNLFSNLFWLYRKFQWMFCTNFITFDISFVIVLRIVYLLLFKLFLEFNAYYVDNNF